MACDPTRAEPGIFQHSRPVTCRCADGQRDGVHTNCSDAAWSWTTAVCLGDTSDPEVQRRQKSLLAGFVEEPAFQITTLTVIDIGYWWRKMCFTNINLAAESRIIWTRRVYKAGRSAKGICRGLGRGNKAQSRTRKREGYQKLALDTRRENGMPSQFLKSIYNYILEKKKICALDFPFWEKANLIRIITLIYFEFHSKLQFKLEIHIFFSLAYFIKLFFNKKGFQKLVSGFVI